MGQTDKRIDAYIEKSADFAKPVLTHLRALVHRACPEVVETVKWSFPHFEYKGILCSMAAFKQHCSFGFWKAAVMDDPKDILESVGKTGMGHLGNIKSVKDLPSDKILTTYVKAAMKLNDDNITVPKPKAAEKKELEVPDYFTKALNKNKQALKTFKAFSYSNQKEYVDWVTEAKTEETRNKRIATALEWLAEGKIKNWKYVK